MLPLLTERLRPGRIVWRDRNLVAQNSLDSLLWCLHFALHEPNTAHKLRRRRSPKGEREALPPSYAGQLREAPSASSLSVLGAHLEAMFTVDPRRGIPGGIGVVCDRATQRRRGHTALEPALKLVRHRFEGTLSVPILQDAKSVRGEKLPDAQGLPLNDVNELVEVDTI